MEKTILKIKVIPRAKETKIVSCNDDLIKIRIHAPAEDNKANEALIDFLKSILKIRKDQITILKGKTSRDKLITIEGLSLKRIMMVLLENMV